MKKKRGKTKYFAPFTTDKDELLQCDSLEQAIEISDPGDLIYKAVVIGRIDKRHKLIKRRKKK